MDVLLSVLFLTTASTANLEIHRTDLEQLQRNTSLLVRQVFPDARCLRVVMQGRESSDLVPSVFEARPLSMVLNPVRVGCSDVVVLVDGSVDLEITIAPLRLADYDRVLLLLTKHPMEMTTFKLSVDIFREARVVVGISGRLLNLGPGGLEPLPNASFIFPYVRHFLADLKGRYLRASTFACPPFSYGVGNVSNSSTYSAEFGELLDGIEMGMFLELSRRLNFSWILEEPPEEHKWGKMFKNGSWSGGITGALHKETVDMAFCFLWVSINGFLSVELTYPWGRICNTLLVPRPARVAMWKAIFFPLEVPVWAAIFVTTIIAALAFLFLARVDSERNSQFYEMGSSVLTTVGMLVLNSYPPPSQRFKHSKPMVHTWAWFCLLATSAYCSNLVAHLTVPVLTQPLDSIVDLVTAGFYWEETYLPYVEMIFNPDSSGGLGIRMGLSCGNGGKRPWDLDLRSHSSIPNGEENPLKPHLG